MIVPKHVNPADHAFPNYCSCNARGAALGGQRYPPSSVRKSLQSPGLARAAVIDRAVASQGFKLTASCDCDGANAFLLRHSGAG